MGKNLHLILKTIKNNSGQMLIEAIVALGVIVIIMTAISVASSTSVSNSTFEKNQSIASKYSKQGMEYVRYIRNTGSTVVSTYEGTYCMPDTNGVTSILSSGCQLNTYNVQNSFVREVEFNQSSVDCNSNTKVTVRVKWTDGKCDQSSPSSKFCHKSEIVSCFDVTQSNSL